VTAVRQPAVTTGIQRVATLLSLFGFASMIVAIGYGLYMLTIVDDEIKVKKGELAELEGQIASLQKEIDYIRNGPLSELVTPKAIAIRRPGLKDQQDRQLFNFIVWLDLPYVRKADIQQVQYVFGDSSFLRNRHKSSESSNGFAVGYLGWGAMRSVPITVAPNQGPEFTIEFRMFDELTVVSKQGDG